MTLLRRGLAVANLTALCTLVPPVFASALFTPAFAQRLNASTLRGDPTVVDRVDVAQITAQVRAAYDRVKNTASFIEAFRLSHLSMEREELIRHGAPDGPTYRFTVGRTVSRTRNPAELAISIVVTCPDGLRSCVITMNWS